MRQLITILTLALGISTVLGVQPDWNNQDSNKIFTIYLVRHSEKDLTSNTVSNPPLTQCGAQRSEYLSNFLSEVPLDAIYSTDYLRTISTALPTAKTKELTIQKYAIDELEVFSKMLIDRKQDALVVGHSNTTGVLAGLLIGEEIVAFDLDIYNRIYQVVIHEENGRLHLFHSDFDCND